MRGESGEEKALQAAEAEARQLHASAHGSEHLLLGLLSAGDALTEMLLADHPELTVDAVRRAIVEAIDDAPHLQRLGVNLDVVRQAEQATAADGRVKLQNRPTAEFMTALDDAASKWSDLVKHKQLPRRTLRGTSLCWLTVLEPSSRAHRLLEALGIDPARLREAVLTDMAEPGSPPPAWPARPRRGLLDRLSSRLTERYVAS